MKSYEVPNCAVCLDELTTNLMATKCGHVFHRACIESSIHGNPVCPLDRKTHTIKQLIPLSYGVNPKQLDDLNEFFGNMSASESKDVRALTAKLAAAIEEKS